MIRRSFHAVGVLAALSLVTACSASGEGPRDAVATTTTTTTTASAAVTTAPAAVASADTEGNVYAHAGVDGLSPTVAGDVARVYVPNGESGTVSVIDPATFRVVDTFPTGQIPQHVVPSYDMRTLWVNNNAGNTLTPIDARTGTRGPSRPVKAPYNLYFTPDGRYMIVVAEREQRLDFRDPVTLEVVHAVDVPCRGVNHIDFSADGSYFIASCEFAGRLIKIATESRALIGTLDLPRHHGLASKPQDVRLVPDGSRFYVADMHADGVLVIDGDQLVIDGFIATGTAAHGIYPSRDGTRMYVTNRGTHSSGRRPPGDVVVIDPFAGELGTIVARWPIPGGGSPDMGNVSADGTQFWVSGRYDDEVYCFDTTTGELLARIPVGKGPHGLTVWPQPGRYSLGHTGNMR